MNINSSAAMAICHCGLCGDSLVGKIRYEGAIRENPSGPWKVMCEVDFALHGLGLGIGRGQKFDAQGRCLDGNQTVGGKVGEM